MTWHFKENTLVPSYDQLLIMLCKKIQPKFLKAGTVLVKIAQQEKIESTYQLPQAGEAAVHDTLTTKDN